MKLLPLGVVLTACGSSAPPAREPAAAPAAASEEDAVRAIETMVNRHGAATHRCWRRAAVTDFHVDGEVELAVTIGPGGSSRHVDVVRDTAKHPVLTACLTELWRGVEWPAALSSGDRVQVPLVFVQPDAQYLVASDDAPARDQAGVSVKDVLSETNTGNAAASLRLLEIPIGAKAELASATVARAFFVLAGEGLVNGEAASGPLRPGDVGLVRPGERIGLFPRGAAMSVAVVSVPGGTPSRSRRAPLVHVGDVKPLSIGGGKGEVRILLEPATTQDGSLALSALTAGAGMAVPPHTHDGSTEMLLILEGRGAMTVAGDQHDVAPGDAIQIPPGVEHSVTVTGDAPLKAIQVYTPAGPEQRFKQAPPAIPERGAR